MLSASELIVGCLADAADLSLVLPRSRYEGVFLVSSATAVCLDGEFRFHAISAVDNLNWEGMIIPAVRIELDETTAFDADGQVGSLGAMLRRGTELVLVAKRGQSSFRSTYCPIVTGLPACRENMAVGFARWQAVIGRGEEKRVLKTVDIAEQPVV